MKKKKMRIQFNISIIILLVYFLHTSNAECSNQNKCDACTESTCNTGCWHRHDSVLNIFNFGDCYHKKECSIYKICEDCLQRTCVSGCFAANYHPLNYVDLGDCYFLKVHGNWASWTPYFPCSKTCGGGQQNRRRDCNNPSPQYGGSTCYGSSSQNRDCAKHPCPVNGGWSPWTSWSNCTSSCGYATKTRNRTCDNPVPKHGGDLCYGESGEQTKCEVPKCPGCEVPLEDIFFVKNIHDFKTCVEFGYCYEEIEINNWKCHMKKGTSGEKYMSIPQEITPGKQIGDKVTRMQCLLKCQNSKNCLEPVFIEKDGSKIGKCFSGINENEKQQQTISAEFLKVLKP